MNLNNTQELQKNKTYALTATALMTAVTCILAPLSVPIGPVPISLTNFVIFLSLYLLNWKKGTLSLLIYLLLGLAGLPVFSGFAGGIAKLAGPTGGYIIGFIPMAIVAGIIIDKFHQRWIQIVAMIIGTAICYAFGTVWFCFQSGYTVAAALAVCVIPFIPADLIKIVIVTIIGPMIRKRFSKSTFSRYYHFVFSSFIIVAFEEV